MIMRGLCEVGGSVREWDIGENIDEDIVAIFVEATARIALLTGIGVGAWTQMRQEEKIDWPLGKGEIVFVGANVRWELGN